MTACSFEIINLFTYGSPIVLFLVTNGLAASMVSIFPNSIVSTLLQSVAVLFLVVRRHAKRVKCPCPAWGWEEGATTTPRQPTRRGELLPSRVVP